MENGEDMFGVEMKWQSIRLANSFKIIEYF